MYYSGLYKTIRDLEEKKFYDIALLFLEGKGYPNLVIVDGRGDGGRDVTSSWDHIRIQLSVRRDWKNKINNEAGFAIDKDAKHFIYVTNRRINDHEKDQFLQEEFRFKGGVEITIYDLASITTALSLPGIIDSVNQTLGRPISGNFEATPKEIAISNTLLFSNEAKELRDEIIENSICAHILSDEGISEAVVIEKVCSDLGNVALNVQIAKTINSLRSKGRITDKSGSLYLSQKVRDRLRLSRNDFEHVKSKDLKDLEKEFSLPEKDAEIIVNIALEILSRNGSFDSDEPYSVKLQEFVANHNLHRKRTKLYEALSKLTTAHVAAYGDAVSHILSTNTYDIFRSLGRTNSVTAILDSSVAMPMLFGLSFSKVKSRYGIGAAALNEMCKSHRFKLSVPKPYLNEMASHGQKAIEYIDIYDLIGDESRSILKASGNAYLSHYGHIRDDELPGSELGVGGFLSYFGINKGAPITKIERRIEEVLSTFRYRGDNHASLETRA